MIFITLETFRKAKTWIASQVGKRKRPDDIYRYCDNFLSKSESQIRREKNLTKEQYLQRKEFITAVHSILRKDRGYK